jgi:hypothetical protein
VSFIPGDIELLAGGKGQLGGWAGLAKEECSLKGIKYLPILTGLKITIIIKSTNKSPRNLSMAHVLLWREPAADTRHGFHTCQPWGAAVLAPR